MNNNMSAEAWFKNQPKDWDWMTSAIDQDGTIRLTAEELYGFMEEYAASRIEAFLDDNKLWETAQNDDWIDNEEREDKMSAEKWLTKLGITDQVIRTRIENNNTTIMKVHHDSLTDLLEEYFQYRTT